MDKKIYEEIKETLTDNLIQLSKLYKKSELEKVIKPKMFDKCNSNAFQQISYFLVSIIEGNNISKVLPWPIHDSLCEKEYRQKFENYLKELKKSNDDIVVVKASYLSTPNGINVVRMFFKLTEHAIHQHFARQNKIILLPPKLSSNQEMNETNLKNLNAVVEQQKINILKKQMEDEQKISDLKNEVNMVLRKLDNFDKEIDRSERELKKLEENSSTTRVDLDIEIEKAENYFKMLNDYNEKLKDAIVFVDLAERPLQLNLQSGNTDEKINLIHLFDRTIENINKLKTKIESSTLTPIEFSEKLIECKTRADEQLERMGMIKNTYDTLMNQANINEHVKKFETDRKVDYKNEIIDGMFEPLDLNFDDLKLDDITYSSQNRTFKNPQSFNNNFSALNNKSIRIKRNHLKRKFGGSVNDLNKKIISSTPVFTKINDMHSSQVNLKNTKRRSMSLQEFNFDDFIENEKIPEIENISFDDDSRNVF